MIRNQEGCSEKLNKIIQLKSQGVAGWAFFSQQSSAAIDFVAPITLCQRSSPTGEKCSHHKAGSWFKGHREGIEELESPKKSENLSANLPTAL
jgi:hypothetical protein